MNPTPTTCCDFIGCWRENDSEQIKEQFTVHCSLFTNMKEFPPLCVVKLNEPLFS
jgi:hypothetical protein